MVRAKVRTKTSAEPDRRNVLAHSLTVVPVVKTSSMSKIRLFMS